ncbi:MAG: hypothetical protein WBI04_05190 [Trichlorobacter sp.]
MLTLQLRSIAAILSVVALFPLASALAATSTPPAPSHFTIPAKERIVIYTAYG